MTAIRYTLSLAAGLLLASAAPADETRGIIVRIDPDKKLLRLQGRGPRRGSVLNLHIDAKTDILLGGEPATLNDLAPGRRIRVVFEMRDGKAVAQTIRGFGLRLGRAKANPERSATPPPKVGDGVTGTLQRVSLTDREVVIIGPGVKGAKTETTIAVPEGTSIRKDGKPIAFDALKEGDTATVKTEKRKGRLTALSIQLGQSSAAASPDMQPRRNVGPRLRKVLKLAEELLREFEESNR